MKTNIYGIVIAIILFFPLQMILPFPFGLVLWMVSVVLIILYVKKHPSVEKDSVLNYRRIDPINEKEKNQNDEALRILEKKYIEEKISKEEYLKRKKEFEDIEYNTRKCKVCGSEEFEFISEERIEDLGEYTSDIGCYKCKKCGAK
ncbi:MAG: hypothetical protein J4F36_06500 [Nitrosopumilaceae archaeon]|nr:hypothetical protein [Nitrosopumilaceae archaeon]